MHAPVRTVDLMVWKCQRGIVLLACDSESRCCFTLSNVHCLKWLCVMQLAWFGLRAPANQCKMMVWRNVR